MWIVVLLWPGASSHAPLHLSSASRSRAHLSDYALLATYLVGSSSALLRALLTSLALSVTHVSVSVVIVLLSLPLVNIMFGGGGPGSSPVLENVSRGMLGIIGIWMIWRALSASHHHHHHDREGLGFGVMAGLVPCPLTLFIMNFAVLHQVVIVGILFAVSMMTGIALTLGLVAATAVLFRKQVVRLLASSPHLLRNISRVFEVMTGAVLITLAAVELMRWV
jgi:nickel/cobalt exporter